MATEVLYKCYFEIHRSVKQSSNIGDLATCFRVEACLIEYQANQRRRCSGAIHKPIRSNATSIDSLQLCLRSSIFCILLLIVCELHTIVCQPSCLLRSKHQLCPASLSKLCCSGGTCFLFCHCGVEACSVNCETLFSCHQLGQVQRKTHRIVKEKCRLPVEGILTFTLDRGSSNVEFFHSTRQCLGECGLLVCDHRLYVLLLLD
mmetsp:Transcript_27215/g.43671  ORF Transcript_27215/g.43671 Transcript_27215/m.43671 type:complete len:204 (+) Transcript_27215:1283-1894(+)